MARRWTNQTYLKIRRWVDGDIASSPQRPISLFGPFVFGALALAVAYREAPGAVPWVWVTVIPLVAAWMGFGLWRGSRLMQAAAIRGDRDFDRRIKFSLPSEYAFSESVTGAQQRKRRTLRK